MAEAYESFPIEKIIEKCIFHAKNKLSSMLNIMKN